MTKNFEITDKVLACAQPLLRLGAVCGSFFICKADDYSSFEKGKVYSKNEIGKYLIEHPKDWRVLLNYPTTTELLECIESGKNKSKIVKALKQWQKLPLTVKYW